MGPSKEPAYLVRRGFRDRVFTGVERVALHNVRMKNPDVCVAQVSDIYAARVYAAQLRDAGIAVRVHGETSGPYPLSVGQMAVTELWVGCGDVEAAEEILRPDDVETDPLG